MQARPIVLGLINAALPGLGYVFIAKRRPFGWLLFASTLLSLLARRWNFPSADLIAQNQLAGWLELGSIIIITVAFGVDAYLQAKEE